MLPKSFVHLFCTGVIFGLSFATDTAQCPGKCIPSAAPCGSSSGTDLCGKDLKCCLDDSNETTTARSESIANLSSDIEDEMRFLSYFEMEESTESSLSSMFGIETEEGEPSEEETYTCPGDCMPNNKKRFCGYPFTYLDLCAEGEFCCLQELTAFKIRNLMRQITEHNDTDTKRQLKEIFRTGETEELENIHCQHQCLQPKNVKRCQKLYLDYYCPGLSVCCDESSSAQEQTPEDCKGRCLPPQVQDWCRPPQVLFWAPNCRSPLLCCSSPEAMEERSGYSLDAGEEEAFYSSREGNFKSPDPLPLDDLQIHSRSRAWMVADPQSSSLRDQHTSDNLDLTKLGEETLTIPVSYSSEQFLIPDDEEISEQSDADDLAIRPLCPGSCMTYLTRFLCFRNYTTYDGFYCPGRSVCCAKLEDIRKHEEYLKATYPFLQGNFRKLNPSCGKKGRKEETSKTLPGEWCWQVAVIDAHNQYVCGGVLIEKHWAITTAQCVAGFVSQNQPLFIRAGVNDLSSPEENSMGQTRSISNTYLHYGYDPATLDNDIALLKLQNPISLNSNVCLACLPTRLTVPKEGTLCKLTGYGFVSEAAEMVFKMTEAQIPVVHDMDCISNMTDALATVYILPSTSFCAGHEKNFCQSASGNPLVCKVDDHYELTGLVSWSVGCQLQEAPSVFVKIPALLGWINQVIAMDHQLYPGNVKLN